jgi:hypothetical protein
VLPLPEDAAMPSRLAVPALTALLAAVPALARADAVVNGSGLTEMLACAGAPAVVNGDRNQITFSGGCASLHLTGSANRITIDLAPGAILNVTGGDNSVRYTPVMPTPVVTAEGTANHIVAGTGTAPPPAAAVDTGGTLLLRGDSQTRDADCAGRDALIEGSNDHVTLRGGCRSVTVRGRNDTIDAALLPGAPLRIGGDGVTLHYHMTRPGPPPTVTVTGSGSHALQVSGSNVAVQTPSGAATTITRAPSP